MRFLSLYIGRRKKTRAKNGTLASIQESVDIKDQHFFEWKNCFVSLLEFHYGSFDFVKKGLRHIIITLNQEKKKLEKKLS